MFIWASSVLTRMGKSVRLAACPEIKQFPLHIHLPDANEHHSGRRFHQLVVHSDMNKLGQKDPLCISLDQMWNKYSGCVS